MSWKTSQNALSTTAELLLAGNKKRVALQVVNTDASITVYISPTPAVTSSTGFPLTAGSSYKFTTEAQDDVYAIAASGTPTVAMLEEFA